MPQSKSGDVSIKVTLDTSAAKREAARLQEELSKVRQTASRAREARESQEYKPLTNRSQQPSPNQIPVSGGGAAGGGTGGGTASGGGVGKGGGIGPSTSYQSPSPNGLNQIAGMLSLAKLTDIATKVLEYQIASRNADLTPSAGNSRRAMIALLESSIPGIGQIKQTYNYARMGAEYASSFTPGIAENAKGTWAEGPARTLNTYLHDSVATMNLWEAKNAAFQIKLDAYDKYIDATIRLSGKIPGFTETDTYGETMYSISKRQNLFDKMIKHADDTSQRLADKGDLVDQLIKGSASR